MTDDILIASNIVVSMIEVAIVGAGPAGSRCACKLAENSLQPAIFDHTHPREKPCGGLVTPLTQEVFPFLATLPIERAERDRICLVSPLGKQVWIRSRRHKALCFSRQTLDKKLVDLAVQEGAQLVEEKVVSVERMMDCWKIGTGEKSYLAKVLIGADGVNSAVRKSIIGPLSKTDMGFCYGCFLKGLEKEEITIRFLSHIEGYSWVIPRKDHACVGIGTSQHCYSSRLNQELTTFIEHHFPHADMISEWASLIPNVKRLKTFQTPLAGSNWIIIGDAAGHVDPVTGEGIMYALLDSELAAEAIINNNPRQFDLMWREVYGKNLFTSIRFRSLLYRGFMLEFYCQFLRLRNGIRL